MTSVYTDRYTLFLKLLINARKEAEVTQQELAEKLGKPQSYVSKYERAERRLDVIEFIKIAETLNTDPATIMKKLNSKPFLKSGVNS